MSLRICSKDLVDKGVLGRRWEEVVLSKKTEVFLVMSSVGKDLKTGMEGGRQGCAGDDVLRAVWNVREWVVLLVFKSGPDKLRGWGMWDKSNG